MQHRCFKCGNVTTTSKVGRRDSCEKCSADLHCCRNCRHYDVNEYNNCREPSAERVVDKERSNFCDFFSFAIHSADPLTGTSPATSEKDQAIAQLEALFKK